MPILNYTTRVSAEKSVAEITKRLSAHGASHIMIGYDGSRLPASLTFVIPTKLGEQTFRLPANIQGVERVLARVASRKRVSRAKVDNEQARRVAWRILKDWVSVQLALVEAGLVSADQVLLPYMLRGDTTFYQAWSEQKLQLEGPRR